MNLFIAVLSEHVNLQRGAYFMTEEQKRWVEFRRQMLLLRPKVAVPATASPLRRHFQSIALSRAFRTAVWWCIVLNVVAFMLMWDGQPPLMAAVLRCACIAPSSCISRALDKGPGPISHAGGGPLPPGPPPPSPPRSSKSLGGGAPPPRLEGRGAFTRGGRAHLLFLSYELRNKVEFTGPVGKA